MFTFGDPLGVSGAFYMF